MNKSDLRKACKRNSDYIITIPGDKHTKPFQELMEMTDFPDTMWSDNLFVYTKHGDYITTWKREFYTLKPVKHVKEPD